MLITLLSNQVWQRGSNHPSSLRKKKVSNGPQKKLQSINALSPHLAQCREKIALSSDLRLLFWPSVSVLHSLDLNLKMHFHKPLNSQLYLLPALLPPSEYSSLQFSCLFHSILPSSPKISNPGQWNITTKIWSWCQEKSFCRNFNFQVSKITKLNTIIPGIKLVKRWHLLPWVPFQVFNQRFKCSPY